MEANNIFQLYQEEARNGLLEFRRFPMRAVSTLTDGSRALLIRTTQHKCRRISIRSTYEADCLLQVVAHF